MVHAKDQGTDAPTGSVRANHPRVGVVSAWFDPEQRSVWSGVPSGIIGELRRLGVYAGRRDVTPARSVARLALGWARLTGRSAGWTRRVEMRTITRVSDAANLLSSSTDVDGWVQFLGANGRVVRGRYVTVYDMAPSQLARAGPAWASSFGFPNATQGQLDWVSRRQSAACRSAHACCVASRWAADALVRDHGIDASRVHVIGYGRNAVVPEPPDRDWSIPRFLFVGRDFERKNGAAVVRAFGRVRRSVPHAQLDVVGDHPALAEEGVTGHGRIDVHEPAGRQKLESLFANATVFVLPSFIEPFGIVYVEAATAGIASIATSIGGTADSVGDGGVLVDPHDDDAIYRAMLELCDADHARALGAIARRRAEAFTWSAVGQRVLRSLDLGEIPDVQLAEFL